MLIVIRKKYEVKNPFIYDVIRKVIIIIISALYRPLLSISLVCH